MFYSYTVTLGRYIFLLLCCMSFFNFFILYEIVCAIIKDNMYQAKPSKNNMNMENTTPFIFMKLNFCKYYNKNIIKLSFVSAKLI